MVNVDRISSFIQDWKFTAPLSDLGLQINLCSSSFKDGPKALTDQITANHALLALEAGHTDESEHTGVVASCIRNEDAEFIHGLRRLKTDHALPGCRELITFDSPRPGASFAPRSMVWISAHICSGHNITAQGRYLMPGSKDFDKKFVFSETWEEMVYLPAGNYCITILLLDRNYISFYWDALIFSVQEEKAQILLPLMHETYSIGQSIPFCCRIPPSHQGATGKASILINLSGSVLSKQEFPVGSVMCSSIPHQALNHLDPDGRDVSAEHHLETEFTYSTLERLSSSIKFNIRESASYGSDSSSSSSSSSSSTADVPLFSAVSEGSSPVFSRMKCLGDEDPSMRSCLLHNVCIQAGQLRFFLDPQQDFSNKQNMLLQKAVVDANFFWLDGFTKSGYFFREQFRMMWGLTASTDASVVSPLNFNLCC